MQTEAQQKKYKHIKILSITILIVIGMSAFSYALVPMYNSLCKILGVNGKTGGAVSYDAQHAVIDKSRTVTIEFVANNNPTMQWQFYPEIKKVKLHPGEMKKIAFYAKNNSDHTMIVQAIPSVTPGLAAQYLKKTECFCFTQQTLKSKQAEDMPVLFHIDPALPKTVSTITLSYTLYDVTDMKIKQKKEAGKIG